MRGLVIGCRGQDGTYLSQLLRNQGYDVLGVDRHQVEATLGWDGERVIDIRNMASVKALIERFQPDEIYYLAAFHFSSEDSLVDDHEDMARSFEVNTLPVNHFLGAIDACSPQSRFFYAASSRVFGNAKSQEQDEQTPLNPVCTYGISKTAGMHICRYYREKRGRFASSGIFFNHESPLRDPRFVSRKVVSAAVRISRGSKEKLVLGNLDARVDWGYAPDFAQAMWRILRLDESGEFVIGTGVLHSVRDLAEAAFSALGLDWTKHVSVEQSVLQGKAPGFTLRANPAKLKQLTGWRPSVSFQEMISTMVQAELAI